MEGWSKVEHDTEWINSYEKMLEYIKVEDMLNRRGSRKVKELIYERKQVSGLNTAQIIEAISLNIQTIYDKVINVNN